MKLIIRYFAILVFFISCEKQPEPDLPPKVVESIQARVDNGLNPSIIVGIIDKKGPRVYSFGKTSLTGTPVDEHTIYEIGSISKVFTAILLAHQAELGKVSINDPAQKYLPSAARVPKRGDKEITLGHLSDHTSGLPRMPDNFNPEDFSNPYADYSVDQMYEFISRYALTRDVGAEYEYSNLAQGLLGHMLALNAGMSYEDLMIEIIAHPLGMNETKVVLNDSMKKNLAIGHSEGEEVSNWDIPTMAGAGGIRSSVHDMLKFLAANIGLTQTSLKSAMDKSHSVRHLKAGSARVGLGWHITKGKLGDVISHSGGTGGYRTFAGFVKEMQKGVVVFTNSSAGADDIGYRLLNPTAIINPSKPTATSGFKEVLDSAGIQAAIGYYKDLKNNHGDDYDFSEGVLNTLGYVYIGKDLVASLAIFKLNVEEYPETYNVYESYGEALLIKGDTAFAIENYKKSLDVNPANANAISVLKELGVNWTPPVVNVPDETLEAYTGTYTFYKGLDIIITREGSRLFGQASGNPKAELYPKSESEFYLKVVRASLTFNKNDKTLTLHQNGQELKGTRIAN